MKIYNSYILVVAVIFMLTTVILIALGQNSLDIYFTLYIIEAFIITELYVYFNNKARHGLTFISAILFAGFMFTLLFQAIKIIA